MDIKDIYWIVALLDGEGHFGMNSSKNAARITLKMTDYDTVKRARDIINPKATILSQDRNGWRTCYIIQINGHYAVGWMMILYSHPYMSARRKEQIRKVLSSWRNAKSHNGFTSTTGAHLVSMIARKHGIPHHEARKRLHSGEYVTDSSGRTYIGSLKPKAQIEFRPIINPF